MVDPASLIGGAQLPYRRPPGALEVLLVRHGAYARGSDPGSDDVMGIHADPKLNALGHEQAESLALRLAALPFDKVFTTSLQRTVQTAAPLLARTAHEAVVIDDLREVYLGEFDGQEFERQRAAGSPFIAAAFEQQRWDVIPGAERRDDFGMRVRRGLDAVANATGTDATAIAFVHAAVIAELCAQITDSRPFAFLAAENTSITTLVRHRSERWELRSFNDTAHLRR